MNDIGIHSVWAPVALASEVSAEKPLGVDIFGTRVVAYRDPAGTAVVQTAWCPHLGADLSVGQIAEGQIRCPYHHWRFDAQGRCSNIPTGDKIPPGARIASWPVAEAWGLVWAFNGEEPLYRPPGIPGIDESELAVETRQRSLRNLPPWVPVSNGIDFQHLRTLHGLETTEPDEVEFGEHTIEFRIETERYTQHGRITGTNVFAQHLRREGMDLYMLFAGAPIDANRSRGFNAVGIRNSGNPAVVAAQLQAVRGFVDALLAEDDPVLNTMRFKPGAFVASDRYLSRFFKWVTEFPTAPAA